jgi:transposase
MRALMRNGKRLDLETRKEWILEQYETRPQRLIAAELTISVSTLRKQVAAWQGEDISLLKNVKSYGLEEYRDAVTELVREGITLAWIAKKFGCSHTLVSFALKRWGVLTVAEQHRRACNANKAEIIKRLEAGESQKSMLRWLDVGRGTLSRHVGLWRREGSLNDKNRNWRRAHD